MPVNPPMYQLKFPRYGAGPFVKVGGDGIGKGLSEGVEGYLRAKQQNVQNERQTKQDERQTKQDALAAEIARAKLAQGQTQQSLDTRRLDRQEARQTQQDTRQTEQDERTERYRQGLLRMKMLGELLNQGIPTSEAVSLVNKEFAQPQAQAGAPVPRAMAGGDLSQPAQSQGPPHYQPEGAAQASQGITQTATNPKTGQKIGWNGKEWVPLQ